MGILYYFLGLIPLGILTFLFNTLIEKLKLKEKLKKFDESNSGSVYNFIKSIAFIIFVTLCFLSIGFILIVPMYIGTSIIEGKYIDAILFTLLGSIIFSIYCNYFES